MWLTAVLAVAGIVVGAFVNWMARPKWTEGHPRRTVAVVAVLVAVVAGTPVLVSFLHEPNPPADPGAPRTTAPVQPPADPSMSAAAPASGGAPPPSDGPGAAGGGRGSTSTGRQVPPVGAQPVPPNAPVGITTSGLSGIKVGDAWSADLGASGGMAPYRWSLAGGSLPAGLVLQPSGRISGTATAPQAKVFSVSAVDVRGETATRKFSLKPVARTGDINLDGPVGCLDKQILQSQWDQTGDHLSGDLNSDGVVTLTDLSIMLSHWTGDSASCEGT